MKIRNRFILGIVAGAVILGGVAFLSFNGELSQGRVFGPRIKEIQFEVRLNTNKIPASKMNYDDRDTVKLHVQDEISFSREITSNASYDLDWNWGWDDRYLKCSYSATDSTFFRCTAIAPGTADVSFMAHPTFAGGSTRSVQSNVILVKVGR